jgi:hypothetical protein
VIYFITARDVGRVKIGHAANPQARIVAVQTHSPVPLELERVCDGGLREEADLHALFASARVRGEWFTLTPEIETHMATLPRHQWRHRGWHHAARRAA